MALRQAFLNANEITSIVEIEDGNTVIRMRDGREFSVPDGAVDCWMHIKDVIDPHADAGPLPARDPFVQFSLKG